jgi:hypothetical protein
VVEQRFCKPLVGSSNLSAGRKFMAAGLLDQREWRWRVQES